jgi:hypothetical protein
VCVAFTELTLGRVVGQGGFSIVHEILSMDLDDVFDTSEQETALRKDFARLVNASHNGSGNRSPSQRRYVLKTLRTDLPEDEHTKGIMDLAIEANFLSVPALRQHEHFIGMVAMANSNPTTSRFFVILERLDVTLEKKFNAWRKVVSDNAGYYFPCIGYCCSKTPVLHALWLERFKVALDIASAMLYLHQEGIGTKEPFFQMRTCFDFLMDKRPRCLFFFLTLKSCRFDQLTTISNCLFFSLSRFKGTCLLLASQFLRCITPFSSTADAFHALSLLLPFITK